MASGGANGERRRTRLSQYHNGGENALVRRPPRPGENLERNGDYTRVQLVRMNNNFVRRVERAFKRGKESRSSAGAIIGRSQLPRGHAS